MSLGTFICFRHPKFWTLGIVYGVSSGIFNSWSSVINLNLYPLGVSQVIIPSMDLIINTNDPTDIM